MSEVLKGLSAGATPPSPTGVMGASTICLGGEGGGLSSVKVTGTDGKTVEGSNFKIESADDSNVEVKATKDEATGLITLKIGVYWKR